MRRRRKRHFRIAQLLPSAATRRRCFRVVRRAPAFVQVIGGMALVGVLWFALNWTYQVVRKPSELFFPVSDTLYKVPAQTWDAYGSLFERHATTSITPDFLAALAQVEGSGNPVVRTYWRWALTHRLFEVYKPASSAVGMYQITNGTFGEARRYCVHDHVVVEDGPWYAWRSCWFNGLYTRVVASHAIEMTSAYLDLHVNALLRQHKITKATLQQKLDLAAVIHLCGRGAGAGYARRGLRLSPGQRCGAHDVRGYLKKVDAMRAAFLRLDRAAAS
jgi:hypothetical protein